MHVSIKALVVALVVVAFSSVGHAIFIQPEPTPVDRLAANAEAYIREHPEDPHGYYVLGRVHYLAWSLRSAEIPHFNRARRERPHVVDEHGVSLFLQSARYAEARRRAQAELNVPDVNALSNEERAAFQRRVIAISRALIAEGWTPPPRLEIEQADRHAEEALASLRTAIEKDAANGLYHLSLASLAEQYAPRAAERKLAFADDAEAADEAAARRQWLDGAMTHYRRAFELSKQRDATQEHRPITGLTALVSYEAAAGYARVAEALGEGGGDARLLDAMAAHRRQLEALPMGPITPIVLSFVPHGSLTDLIDGDASVSFDLAGTGRPQRWTWPHADTGILVWDPGATGRVTSGRQLFGSVTWWVFPGDGYRALDLLDDNRDGELAGRELRHLALWFDRNGNGVSDAGEVIPLQDLPIEAMTTHSTSTDGDSPMNPRGVRLNNGAWLPTYDWLAQPAK